jgi:hypothetical protein
MARKKKKVSWSRKKVGNKWGVAVFAFDIFYKKSVKSSPLSTTQPSSPTETRLRHMLLCLLAHLLKEQNITKTTTNDEIIHKIEELFLRINVMDESGLATLKRKINETWTDQHIIHNNNLKHAFHNLCATIPRGISLFNFYKVLLQYGKDQEDEDREDEDISYLEEEYIS